MVTRRPSGSYRRKSFAPRGAVVSGICADGSFCIPRPFAVDRPCPGGNDYFGWLFLAQHYGVPTRLLDWSENPLVAAYFAVLDDPNDDGCIWALGTRGLNETFGVTADLVQIRAQPSGRSRKARSPEIKPSDEREALAIDGQESDPRMLAQMSKFTIHPAAHHWNKYRRAPIGCVSL